MIGPGCLEIELNKRELWRDEDYIGIKRPREYLCSCLYLPRLKVPEGAPKHVQRIVLENPGVLKFDSHGFKQE